MTAPIMAFFNNKSGVEKTSLVYHLAWMYSDVGLRVLAVDLDPQANLSATFLDEDRLEELWERNCAAHTIFHGVQPLIQGTGDIVAPQIEIIPGESSVNDENLALLVGDLSLSGFEDELSAEWLGCLDRKERSFRVISAFARLIQSAAVSHQADIVLVDLGPNLGAINRAALMACEAVVVPLSPDLFSLQGLKNLGPTLKRWREEWQERLAKNPARDLILPPGKMQPLGYIVLQPSVRLYRPVKAYQRWIERIPAVYREAVFQERENSIPLPTEDPYCLGLLKNYQSLMPLAQEAHKPMFHLKPADGALGVHLNAVHGVYKAFQGLAMNIAESLSIPIALIPTGEESIR